MAWVVEAPGPIASRPMRPVDLEVPSPGRGEMLLRVSTCGVCRTDLHVAEGDLPVHRARVVPGHEIVGTVVRVGQDVADDVIGRRVGVGWLRRTCGHCRWCRRGSENLCPESRYTGWDEHGGYAEFALATAAFAYALPDSIDDLRAAPLLCAGVIGYRALRRAALPSGGRLGIYGFGASAHITAQLAIAQGAEVHVLTRGAEARALALELGAASARRSHERPPVPLDSAIIFAPAGDLVPVALEALDRGGTLALAGIHMSSIPELDYQRHLFLERSVESVTSSTRADAEELLQLAARLPLRMHTNEYPLADAARALDGLASGRLTGAAVLKVQAP